ANPQHMAQQAQMMPQQQQHNQLQHQSQQAALAAQFYGGLGNQPAGMQAPPPGLKSAPTPPAPGMGIMGGMFGQQSAFGLPGHQSSNSTKGDEFFQQLVRNREGKCMEF